MLTLDGQNRKEDKLYDAHYGTLIVLYGKTGGQQTPTM